MGQRMWLESKLRYRSVKSIEIASNRDSEINRKIAVIKI